MKLNVDTEKLEPTIHDYQEFLDEEQYDDNIPDSSLPDLNQSNNFLLEQEFCLPVTESNNHHVDETQNRS